MNDKFDFEDELAESIAQIIDEETSEAEQMYREKYGNKKETVDVPNVTRDTNRVMSKKDEAKELKKKYTIIIASVSVIIAIIIAVAVVFINSTLKKNKENYGYYQNLAYEAKDAENYEGAINNFNKAFSYKDKFLKKETITINNSQVKTIEIFVKDMLNMRDCYEKTNNLEKEIEILNSILEYDTLNENAVYYLVKTYVDNEKTVELNDLYTTIKETEGSEKVLAYFKAYECEIPIITPADGEYSKDQTISFTEVKDCKIYYTVDGSDPLTNGTLYTNDFEIKEGITTIKYYMVNKYGIKSDVTEAKYEIGYKAPESPVITPTSGAYSTSAEQMISISNIAAGATAYYEISFNNTEVVPTKDSTKYEEPFVMPEGSFVLSVIVIDEDGLTSPVVSNNYTLTKIDKYNDTAAEKLIISTLKQNKIINDKYLNKDEKKLALLYNTKADIKEMKLWLFNVSLDGEKQDYFYGCDSSTGKIYNVSKNDSNEYVVEELKY